jgi:acetyl-CoA acetyltransferase
VVRKSLQNQVAIVGVGSTPYARDLQRTHLSLGLEAATKALADAGVDRQEIDGICGSGATPLSMGGAGFLSLQGGLGIRRCTWTQNSWLGAALVYTVQAVYSGLCDTALCVQTYVREPGMSRAAARDPFRQRAARYADIGGDVGRGDFAKRWLHSGEPYAAIMRRYCHDFGVGKDAFGLLAVNNRTQALGNPDAVNRTPMSLEDYHSSRMIWDPMQIADMDVPVDCAEAFVVTTAERAQQLNVKPVYVHAMSLGATRVGEFYENWLGWDDNAFTVCLSGLWARSEFTVADIDLFYPYDGYSVDAVAITEAAGFCGIGEATDYFRSSWEPARQMLRLNGKTLVTTGGGALSHGRSGGSNLYAEAVRQLRGDLGQRQVSGARTALIGIGSFFHDTSAAIFTTDV